DAGKKNNFGYNVKYNKSGKSLQGKLNAIIRKNGRVYQIKTNSMDSLVVNPAAGCANATTASPCTAIFTSQANLTDITNPPNPLHPHPPAHTFCSQPHITERGGPRSPNIMCSPLSNHDRGLLPPKNRKRTRHYRESADRRQRGRPLVETLGVRGAMFAPFIP